LERDRAVDAIASAYWMPIYKYLRVRWRADREDASDFTQEFFVRLLEQDLLQAYDPAKGRLRTFLRTCVDRLFLNHSRDAQRLKRGGGATHIALDFDKAEQELAAASTESPEDLFEKEWVRVLFALAVDRLRAHCAAAGKETHFELFERYDLGEADAPSYAELAREFGLATTHLTNYPAFPPPHFRPTLPHPPPA